jgi:hypothetical protein
MTFEEYEKIGKSKITFMDFDDFNNALDAGIKEARKKMGEEKFQKLSTKEIKFKEPSKGFKELYQDGEIYNIDLTDDISYLTKQIKIYNANQL